MKKVLILSFAVLLGCTAATAAPAPAFNPSIINDIQTFQGINTHDMNSIRQQRFRYEEINDAKDLNEEKERINNRNRDVVKEGPMIFQAKPQKDINFVEENGEIKIEGPDTVPAQYIEREKSPQAVEEKTAPINDIEPQKSQTEDSEQLQPNAAPENEKDIREK